MTRGGVGVGEVMNLISNDVNRFDRHLLYLPYLFVAPLSLLVVGLALSFSIRISALATVLFLLILSLFQGKTPTPTSLQLPPHQQNLALPGPLGVLFGSLRRQIAEKTDARVKLVTEVVRGILLIKLCTWEAPFGERVRRARE
jgi:ATP-binding cassette subfamily C (CFTR/MRP) protein 4